MSLHMSVMRRENDMARTRVQQDTARPRLRSGRAAQTCIETRGVRLHGPATRCTASHGTARRCTMLR
eukprot:1661907-Heterocapsa_arctica.AAC.1